MSRIVALRDKLVECHNGKVIPEETPKRKNQCNGTVEETGKTVWEFVRAIREYSEDYVKVKLEYNTDGEKVWYKEFCNSKDKKNNFEYNEMIVITKGDKIREYAVKIKDTDEIRDKEAVKVSWAHRRSWTRVEMA